MSQIQYPQMKTALSIYIETNHSFIMEKLYSEFKTECVKDYELKDLEMEKMITVVKEIFKFGEHNDDMKTFYNKIQTNLERYINSKYRVTDESQDMFINTDILLEAVKYCVEYGFDPIKQQSHFKQKNEEQEIKQQIEVLEKKKRQPAIKKPQQQQKPKRVFIIPKPKTPETKNFLEKHEMPDRKKPARYLNYAAHKKPEQTKIAEPEVNVEPIDLSFLEKNKKMIDMRLFKIYKHYCSQQQNLGNNATFDRILSECTHMNVGNFMLFCKVTSLFKHDSINRQKILSKFKQISDGKRQIEFQQFKKLLKELDDIYIQAKKKNDSSQSTIQQIPTYEARLMLKNAQFLKMKKDVDFPFLTREKQGRELKKYEYNTLDVSLGSSRYKQSASQNHKRQPTMHSGKFSKNLREHLQTKQEINKQLIKSKNKRNNNEGKKIIRLDNLGQYNWPGMQWVIHDGQDDIMFDSLLMKEGHKRDLGKQIRKRASDVEKIENRKKKQIKFYS